jgi:hypothetical protein
MVIKTGKMGVAEHVACVGEVRNAYRILIVEYEGKGLLGRQRHSWRIMQSGLNKCEDVD